MTRLAVGLGNPLCGDDGAGPAAIALLRADPPPGATLALAATPADLPDLLAGAARAVIVDACRSGAAVGTLRRFDAAARPLPGEAFPISTHGIGLAAAIEIARALGTLPSACLVIGIDGCDFGLGASMSPAVRAALPMASALIRERLRRRL